ncbi:MAG: ribonuclease HII [Melioribacteraceae bacterium]|nr:MAG: ribonuclease HII [Melioribacteraceae bacterium]
MKKFDNSFLAEKIQYVAGTDEAGRGPLAGPVVAAAVLFENDSVINGVNDSKKLNEKTREELFEEITKKALSWSYTVIDNYEIDKINILQASLKAMKESVNKLEVKPDLVLIDGNKSFYTEIPVKTVVKGDSKSFAIAAASIIAKVTRDRIMKEASGKYPIYLWHKNKGYPTREHITAIKKYGPCDMHRMTFLSRILSDSPEVRLL